MMGLEDCGMFLGVGYYPTKKMDVKSVFSVDSVGFCRFSLDTPPKINECPLQSGPPNPIFFSGAMSNFGGVLP